MDAELKQIIVPMFLEEAKKNIRAMLSFQEQKEYKKIAAVAHKFKGQALILSLDKIILICDEIEHSTNFKNIEDQLASLALEFEVFKKSL